MTVRLHHRASAEIRDAAARYGMQVDGLDRRFLAAVRQSLDDLEADPERYPSLETLVKDATIRRVLVQGFPYVIIFQVFGSEVFVYAVAHASRRPNYWRRRKRT